MNAVSKLKTKIHLVFIYTHIIIYYYYSDVMFTLILLRIKFLKKIRLDDLHPVYDD